MNQKLTIIFLMLVGLSLSGLCQNVLLNTFDLQPDKTRSENKFIKNCWIGGNVNLGFGSTINTSTFTFGLNPMIGYKITPEFSIGPRVGFSLTNFRVRSSGPVLKAVLFDFSEALFARYKFINVLFAHAEFELAQFQNPFLNQNEIEKVWVNSENAYLGLGYNSGGQLATEIYVLYNFLADDTNILQPFELRFGITWNF